MLLSRPGLELVALVLRQLGGGSQQLQKNGGHDFERVQSGCGEQCMRRLERGNGRDKMIALYFIFK